MDLEFTWKGETVTSPVHVYLRSDRQEGEPLLLGTNVIVPLGLIEPAAGVETRHHGSGIGGVAVRLVRGEKIQNIYRIYAEAKVVSVKVRVQWYWSR